MDLNADGNIDLLGEGYAGLTYILWGQDGGKFKKAVVLKDKSGTDIHLGMYYDFEKNTYIGDRNKSGDKGDFVKAHDWDEDGDLDLIISGTNGAWLRINEGTKKNPVFGTENIHVIKKHYADAFVDWDGDGLWDIIGGDKDGGVYFYKNIGSKKKPAFDKAVCLLKAEDFVNSEYGGTCRTTQVAVADCNGDGKLDLIVGSRSSVNLPAPKHTDAQKKEKKDLEAKMEVMRPKMDELYKKLSEKFKDDREGLMKAMKEDKEYNELMKEFQDIWGKLSKLTAKSKSHAYVFMSLQ